MEDRANLRLVLKPMRDLDGAKLMLAEPHAKRPEAARSQIGVIRADILPEAAPGPA